jgi:hypothetical protein
MKTLDIRFDHCRKEKRRKSENFSDNSNCYKVNTRQRDYSEKADSEFTFLGSNKSANINKTPDEKVENESVDVFVKAIIFKRKFLARMSSLVNN